MSDKKDKIIEAAKELEKALKHYFACKEAGCFHPTLIEDTREAKGSLESARKKFRKLCGMK